MLCTTPACFSTFYRSVIAPTVENSKILHNSLFTFHAIECTQSASKGTVCSGYIIAGVKYLSYLHEFKAKPRTSVNN